MRITLAATILVASVAWMSSAHAQYYSPGPGYPPPPGPGYPPPPGPGYPPPYYEHERPIGAHCEAFLPTQYGPRRLFCRIVDPKPVGRPCGCPPPPGYPPDQFIGGRTVR